MRCTDVAFQYHTALDLSLQNLTSQVLLGYKEVTSKVSQGPLGMVPVYQKPSFMVFMSPDISSKVPLTHGLSF